MAPSDVERAEGMSRRRSTLFFWSAAVFIGIAMLDFPARGTMDFTLVWVVWALLLLANLAGFGGWLCPPVARALTNDEGTRAHRARALSLGFFVATGVALLLAILIRFLPIGAREVTIAVATAGISSALICFAALERASMRDDQAADG